tara:strand:- start:45 stop:362 length:318 start_codon:yes stop_codon:yes gene_type:complete
MEDIYIDTTDKISKDVKLFVAAALLFILFVLYKKITLFQLFVFAIYYKMILIYIENRTSNNDDNSGNETDGYEEDIDNEADDEDEDNSYELLNNDLKELKMKKRE